MRLASFRHLCSRENKLVLVLIQVIFHLLVKPNVLLTQKVNFDWKLIS